MSEFRNSLRPAVQWLQKNQAPFNKLEQHVISRLIIHLVHYVEWRTKR